MIFTFTDEAKEDLIEVFRFIGKQGVMRKRGFAVEFRKCLSQVEDSPLAWPLVGKGIRVRAMRRFGFGIFYRYDDDEIVVGAIMHLKRRLGGISKRF